MTSFCLVVDALGFSAINKNLEGDGLKERVDGWVQLAENVKKEGSIEHVRLISDTLFVVAEHTPEGLKELIKISRELLEEGIKRALPFRGGITQGDAYWDDVSTYGPAIISAYELSENQNWIGISCENTIEEAIDLFSFDFLVPYLVPLKNGPVRYAPTVVWNIPSYSEFYNQLVKDGLTKMGDKLKWSTINKFKNTIDFSIYLKLVRLMYNHMPPNKTFGYFPSELIYQFIDNYEFHHQENPDTPIDWWPPTKER